MTEPMGELTLETLKAWQDWLIASKAPPPRWMIDELCAAARAHIAGSGKYFTPEEQGRMTAAFAQAARWGEREELLAFNGTTEKEQQTLDTTASPGDEELIERLESSCSPYEATKRANLIHEAAARLRSLADEKAEAGNAISSLALELRQKNARIAELEKENRWFGSQNEKLAADAKMLVDACSREVDSLRARIATLEEALADTRREAYEDAAKIADPIHVIDPPTDYERQAIDIRTNIAAAIRARASEDGK
jgi:chromosome segregation ATPase